MSTRFRHTGAITVAAIVGLLAAIPLACSAWYLAPIALVPLGFTFWAWRAGTDVNADELRVRALFGQRRIPWTEVDELGGDARGRAYALLTNGRMVRLTAVRTEDLPQVVVASGQEPPGPTDAPDQ